MGLTISQTDLNAQHAFVTRFELRGQKQLAPRAIKRKSQSWHWSIDTAVWPDPHPHVEHN